MRIKVGTVLESDLLQRAKSIALRERKTLSAVIEDALQGYLARREGQPATPADIKGMFQLTPEQLAEVLEADLFES